MSVQITITNLDILKQFASLGTVIFRLLVICNLSECPNSAMRLILWWLVTFLFCFIQWFTVPPSLTDVVFDSMKKEERKKVDWSLISASAVPHPWRLHANCRVPGVKLFSKVFSVSSVWPKRRNSVQAAEQGRELLWRSTRRTMMMIRTVGKYLCLLPIRARARPLFRQHN